MVNRFAPSQPMGLIRKAILIAVATMMLMLLWASIAISSGGDPYYEMGPDGMMRPDGTIIQTGTGPVYVPGPTPNPSAPPNHLNFRAATTQSNQSIQPNQPGRFIYQSSHQPNGSWLITRNGAKWLTVAARSGYFEITDPNGTRNKVIQLDQTQHVQPNQSRSTH